MRQNKLSLSFTVSILLLALLACTFTAPDQATAFPTENPHLDIERVSLEDAKAAFDSDSAIFVDVRNATSYAEGHIPGAILIPLEDVESLMAELEPDQWIITYCT